MDRPGTDNKIGNLVVISRMGLFPLNLMDGLQCYSPRVGLESVSSCRYRCALPGERGVTGLEVFYMLVRLNEL